MGSSGIEGIIGATNHIKVICKIEDQFTLKSLSNVNGFHVNNAGVNADKLIEYSKSLIGDDTNFNQDHVV
ncbi:MAG: hypothetical protein RCG15_01355 [Candidatus Rickettsia vulgarisii]